MRACRRGELGSIYCRISCEYKGCVGSQSGIACIRRVKWNRLSSNMVVLRLVRTEHLRGMTDVEEEKSLASLSALNVSCVWY